MEVPFCQPEINNVDMIAVVAVLEGPHLSTGPDVVEFEKEFAKYIGTKYAVAVNSGTSALELAIRATAKKFGVTKGKIITPSFTLGSVSGYSNHYPSIIPPLMAVARGAEIIEVHVKLNGTQPLDDAVSIDMDELEVLCRMVREMEEYL